MCMPLGQDDMHKDVYMTSEDFRDQVPGLEYAASSLLPAQRIQRDHFPNLWFPNLLDLLAEGRYPLPRMP